MKMKKNVLSKILAVLAIVFIYSCSQDDHINEVNSQSTALVAKSGSGQLKVLTFNARLYISTIKDEEQRKEALIQYLRNLDYDVIALTEVWKNSTKEEIINALQGQYIAAPYTNNQQQPLGNLPVDTDGLLTLVKRGISIKNAVFNEFQNEGREDAFADKGYWELKLEHPQHGDFMVISSHLQADATISIINIFKALINPLLVVIAPEESNSSIREKQIKEIINDETIKEELSKNNIPVILLGDLNFDGESSEYSINLSNLRNTFKLEDSYRILNPNNKGYTYDSQENKLAFFFEEEIYRLRLDYILSSSNNLQPVFSRVLNDCFYGNEDFSCSDHYGLASEFNFKNAPVLSGNPTIHNSIKEAREELQRLANDYGFGTLAKIIIHNNTGSDLILNNINSWVGSNFYAAAPYKIPSGKYGIAMSTHKTGNATGAFSQISYKQNNQLFSLGTYAPWAQTSTNNVLVDFKPISENELNQNSTRPSIQKRQNGYTLKGIIDKGDQPFVIFTITK